MSLSTFIKLCVQALKFSIKRPIQRFNVYNRSKKYLGPDAKHFMPAPRAIGAMSLNPDKAIQYPHLQAGQSFKSMRARRSEALAKTNDSGSGDNKPMESIMPPVAPAEVDPKLFMPKSFSRTEEDDSLVRSAANKLEVNKSVIKIELNEGRDRKLIQLDEKSDEKQASNVEVVASKPARPLPKCTNLDLSDPASIWVVNKTPSGRLNLDMLQEIMINQLGDDLYWTPKAVADKYNIKEEYAESLLKYLKQIRVVVSPRMARALDYTGLNNHTYQATKHLIYYVDKSLRNQVDKQYDEMYLPTDQPGEEVKSLIEPPAIISIEEGNSETKLIKEKFRVKRPKPLQIAPLNQPKKTKPEPEHRASIRLMAPLSEKQQEIQLKLLEERRKSDLPNSSNHKT